MTAFPSAVTALLAKVPLAPLGPGPQQPSAREELEELLPTLPLECQAGLWLAFGYWEKAHQVAQDLATPEGSYWHAILHRREPDAWNSKYWFRQVGSHPVISALVEQAPALGYDYKNPLDFVDFCDKVRGSGAPEEDLAKQVQHLEWRLLFDHCSRTAVV